MFCPTGASFSTPYCHNPLSANEVRESGRRVTPYLIRRVSDLVGDTPAGRAIALVISSGLFGLAHGYQGWAGVIAAGTIGGLLAMLYFASRRNIWAVILCHALVDTVALSAIYFDRRSWLFALREARSCVAAA